LQRLDEGGAELTHAQAQKSDRGAADPKCPHWARATLKAGAGRGAACRVAAVLIANAPLIR
jgi:hypothetical protein